MTTRRPSTVARPEAMLGDEPLADVDRVVGGRRRRPEDTCASVRQALERGQHSASRVRRARRDDHVGELLVQRPALLRRAARSAAGRAPAGARRRSPEPTRSQASVDLDVEPDDARAVQRLADPRRVDRAAAERDRVDARVVEQLERDLLLELTERGLAVAREDLLDGAPARAPRSPRRRRSRRRPATARRVDLPAPMKPIRATLHLRRQPIRSS